MSVKRIDFENLSLQDALDLAILIEDEAKERYEEFASQMELHDTPDAARFFAFMAENEAKHGEELTIRRKRLFQDAPRRVSRAMLFDVEAPDYDKARAFMTPLEAMRAALSSEEKAHAFFVAALPRLVDPDVRALFEELRDEEIVHHDLVKAQIAKLPDEPEPPADGFVDEPHAH